MDNLIEKKYIHVPKFLTKEELNLLQPWCKNRAVTAGKCDAMSPLAPSFYEDPLISSLLESKKETMEKISKLQLLPSYCYWRAYIHGSILKSHKDRGSCEVSVTINLDSCESKWPIHMDGTWLDLDVGDAVLYMGCDVEHGRNPFEGRYCAQAFLHYVQKEGLFAHLAGDTFVKTTGVK
jgi:hypothetical protein